MTVQHLTRYSHSAIRSNVSAAAVVLDLLADDAPQGRYTVHVDGRIEPTPPSEAAESLLRRQASALRGELDVHDVPCPRCGRTLYRLGQLAPGVFGVAPGSPDLEHDERGYFKTCPHCSRRVAMEHASTLTGGGFRIAPKQ